MILYQINLCCITFSFHSCYDVVGGMTKFQIDRQPYLASCRPFRLLRFMSYRVFKYGSFIRKIYKPKGMIRNMVWNKTKVG